MGGSIANFGMLRYWPALPLGKPGGNSRNVSKQAIALRLHRGRANVGLTWTVALKRTDRKVPVLASSGRSLRLRREARSDRASLAKT